MRAIISNGSQNQGRSGMAKHTRILLVDDHQMFREGLRRLLETEPDIEVVGEADDGNTASDMTSGLAPDVVVMDISMPSLNGIDATRMLQKEGCTSKILLLTMHDSVEMLRAAALAGASGYLLKSDTEELLVSALTRLSEGHSFVSPSFEATLVDQLFH